MPSQSELEALQTVISGLERNKVATFAYTSKAFDDNNVDGVETFDRTAEQNIPKESCTDYNSTVLQKGVRSQGASIPRQAWNHFIGRISYNLNKTVQIIKTLTNYLATSFAANCFEYDPAAYYRQGDVCYVVNKTDNAAVYAIFKRVNDDPDILQGVSPLSPDQTEWQAVVENSTLNHRHNGTDSLKVSYNDLIDTNIIVEYIDNKVGEETAARTRRIQDVDIRIDGVENLGHYAGAFDTFGDLPKNINAFSIPVTINDFVTVRTDETRNNAVTRYVVKEIDDENGSIDWAYDVTYSTDISGKTDKVSGAVDNNLAGLDAGGNLTDSGKSTDDFIQAVEKGAANGVATLNANGLVPVSQLPSSNGLLTVSRDNTLSGNGTSSDPLKVSFPPDNAAPVSNQKQSTPYEYKDASTAYDLNTFRTVGDYTLCNPSSVTNFPSGWGTGNTNAAILKVRPFYMSGTTTHAVIQVLYKRGTNQMYVRYSTSSTAWSAWEQIALLSSPVFTGTPKAPTAVLPPT